eukprot:3536331-Amphidinium_carterae.1
MSVQLEFYFGNKLLEVLGLAGWRAIPFRLQLRLDLRSPGCGYLCCLCLGMVLGSPPSGIPCRTA